ncbi:DinB family protein [bacterium]|nr:MAG: DinB family protein [bacterium]
MDAVQEALRQLDEGRDFSSPRSVLRISAEKACQRKPGAPYSIAENVAHADGWQRMWLARVKGEPRPAHTDWPAVDSKDWPAIRESFCAGLEEAMALAERAEGNEAETLLRIVVHGAYHIGQCVLLKRL